jgi:hypothetical protein
MVSVLISWWEQAKFQWDDDEVHFVLDQHGELDFYSPSSLKQQSVGGHVAPFGHIILIPSQPVSKDYNIGIGCFSAKHTALRRKSKDWLARNQNNVSEWSDMSTRGLSFQWASIIKIQLSVLV